MAKSKETSGKKEKEKLRLKKRKEKEAKMEERKANAGSTSFESMLAYVDEDGNLTSTPPDASKRKEIDVDSIRLGSANERNGQVEDKRRQGTISSFFHDKGFGFISDKANGAQIFVHKSELAFTPNVGDAVSFEITQTHKGDAAINITKE